MFGLFCLRPLGRRAAASGSGGPLVACTPQAAARYLSASASLRRQPHESTSAAHRAAPARALLETAGITVVRRRAPGTGVRYALAFVPVQRGGGRTAAVFCVRLSFALSFVERARKPGSKNQAPPPPQAAARKLFSDKPPPPGFQTLSPIRFSKVIISPKNPKFPIN